MAADQLNEAIQQIVKWLRKNEYRMTEQARRDGYALGYTETRMVDHILSLIEKGVLPHEVQLGEPPGSGGVDHAINDRDMYYKMKLEFRYVLIMSFKKSKHSRGH